MKWAFFLGGIIEIIGAFVLFVKPDIVFNADLIFLAKMYGLSALVIGIIHLIMYYFFELKRSVRLIYVTFMGFHAGLAMTCYSFSKDLMPLQYFASLTHLLCFTVFFIFYLKEMRGEVAK